jgi:hypothetical protein
LAEQWADHVISDTKDALEGADDWANKPKKADDIQQW